MNEVIDFESTLGNECVETLMLISAFGETPYRHRALKELQKRRLLKIPELSVDDFTTNLSVIF